MIKVTWGMLISMDLNFGFGVAFSPLNSANISLIPEVILTFLIHTVSIFSTFLFIEEGEITEASGWLCYYSSFGATGELSVVHS